MLYGALIKTRVFLSKTPKYFASKSSLNFLRILQFFFNFKTILDEIVGSPAEDSWPTAQYSSTATHISPCYLPPVHSACGSYQTERQGPPCTAFLSTSWSISLTGWWQGISSLLRMIMYAYMIHACMVSLCVTATLEQQINPQQLSWWMNGAQPLLVRIRRASSWATSWALGR